MLVWKDKNDLNLYLDAALNTIGAAKQVIDVDECAEDKAIKIIQTAQDMLCEAVDILVKSVRLENECGAYCSEATTGKGIPVTVELLGTEAEE